MENKSNQRIRLIESLKRQFPHLSRSNLKELIADQKIYLNGKIVHLCDKIYSQEVFHIEEKWVQKKLVPNSQIDCLLLKKTKDFIFFCKGERIHSVAHRFYTKDTAANWLLTVDPNLSQVGNPLESGLAHRLDYETSGVMVAARHKEALSFIKEGFKKHLINKEYLCLTAGPPPDPGLYKAFGGKHPKSNKRILIQLKPDRAQKLERLQTEILSSQKTPKGYLVRVRLITGYRHQIRAHLALLGSPVMGDALYGGEKGLRLYLHSEKISFIDLQGNQEEAICLAPFVMTTPRCN